MALPEDSLLNIRQIFAYLKKRHLFNEMADEEIGDIARSLIPHVLSPEEVLFEQGFPGESFYFIYSGNIRITRTIGQREKNIAVLEEGDFFGEGALLARRSRNASAKAINSVLLLRMQQEDFHAMIRKHPEILIEFETVTKSYEIARHKDFDWLREDETLHLVLQKHRMLLVFSLILPFLVLLFGMTGAFFGQTSGVTFFMWVGGVVAVGGLVWGIWNYIDWGNDYYVVTDKRVIWDEEILFLYESIQEAALVDVRAIDISSSIIQQVFGYGDIIIRTYTGNIEMADVGEPELIKNFIDEYWKRALEHSKDDELDEIDRRLRQKLGLAVKKKRSYSGADQKN